MNLVCFVCGSFVCEERVSHSVRKFGFRMFEGLLEWSILSSKQDNTTGRKRSKPELARDNNHS